MSNQLTTEQIKVMLLKVADALIEKEEELGELDRKIGDGDHGIGMANGARAIQKTLLHIEISSVDQLFREVGSAMMESMGGASGVIFSSLFLGLSKVGKNQQHLAVVDFAQGVEQAVIDIKKRGKAKLGDKTMLDALEPASEALQENSEKNFVDALKHATAAAEQGVENTKQYVAKFGRAKFLGDRSVGYQDAGATSVYIIFKEMYHYAREEFK